MKGKISKLKLYAYRKIHIYKNRRKEEKHQVNAIKRGNCLNKKGILHIAFLITEFEQIVNAGDKYSAIGVGTWLAEKYDCVVSYYTRLPEYEWGNVSSSVDYVICMTPEVDVMYLKKKNIKVIAWIRGNTQTWLKHLNMNLVDGIITSSKIVSDIIKKNSNKNNVLGIVNLGVPIDIQKELKYEKIDYKNREIDISFIGNLKGHNRDIVNNLDLTEDLNFKFYGNLGKNDKWNSFYCGPVQHSKIIDIYSNSKIVIEDIAPRNRGTVNLRIFEAATCGALVISNEDKSLLELFDEDEIITYKDKDDLTYKINYYLSHEEERITKAEKLRDKVVRKYTFENEAGRFLNYINKLNCKN